MASAGRSGDQPVKSVFLKPRASSLLRVLKRWPIAGQLTDRLRGLIEAAGGWISLCRLHGQKRSTRRTGLLRRRARFRAAGDFVTARKGAAFRPGAGASNWRGHGLRARAVFSKSAPLGPAGGRSGWPNSNAWAASPTPTASSIYRGSAPASRPDAGCGGAPSAALGRMKPTCRPFSGAVVGNELLDAMPVSLVWREDGIQARRASRSMPAVPSPGPTGPLPAVLAAAAEIAGNATCPRLGRNRCPGLGGGRTHPGKRQRAPHRLRLPGGSFFAQRSSGTLMCHHRHQAHTDPFCCPGCRDITAHVDFHRHHRCCPRRLEIAGYHQPGPVPCSTAARPPRPPAAGFAGLYPGGRGERCSCPTRWGIVEGDRRRPGCRNPPGFSGATRYGCRRPALSSGRTRGSGWAVPAPGGRRRP